MARIAIYPKHPERICWGCEKYCSVSHLSCRETRVAHPVELFGEDWEDASNLPPGPDVEIHGPRTGLFLQSSTPMK
jgi:hypothetical protein